MKESYWIKPDGDVIYAPSGHVEYVKQHWQEEDLPADINPSNLIFNGWVRISGDNVILQHIDNPIVFEKLQKLLIDLGHSEYTVWIDSKPFRVTLDLLQKLSFEEIFRGLLAGKSERVADASDAYQQGIFEQQPSWNEMNSDGSNAVRDKGVEWMPQDHTKEVRWETQLLDYLRKNYPGKKDTIPPEVDQGYPSQSHQVVNRMQKKANNGTDTDVVLKLYNKFTELGFTRNKVIEEIAKEMLPIGFTIDYWKQKVQEILEIHNTTDVQVAHQIVNRMQKKADSDVQDVIDRGYNLDDLKCRYCGSSEVTFNQGINDAHCAECGEWQLEKEEEEKETKSIEHEERWSKVAHNETDESVRGQAEKHQNYKPKRKWLDRWIKKEPVVAFNNKVHNEEFISEWFLKAFNKHPDYDRVFFRDWVRRFNNGTAIGSMDSDRRKVYFEMIKQEDPLIKEKEQREEKNYQFEERWNKRASLRKKAENVNERCLIDAFEANDEHIYDFEEFRGVSHGTFKTDSYEYLWYSDSEVAEEMAIEQLKDNVWEYLGENYSFYIDEEKAEQHFREIYYDWNSGYADGIESEEASSDEYENRLQEEMAGSNVSSKEDFIQKMTDDQINEGGGGYEHYKSYFGLEEANKQIRDNELVDEQAWAESFIDNDGFANILSGYDGRYEVTDDGVVYMKYQKNYDKKSKDRTDKEQKNREFEERWSKRASLKKKAHTIETDDVLLPAYWTKEDFEEFVVDEKISIEAFKAFKNDFEIGYEGGSLQDDLTDSWRYWKQKHPNFFNTEKEDKNREFEERWSRRAERVSV